MATVVGAVPSSLRVVRVTFNTALSDFSIIAATGALNPANWTLTGQVVQPVPVAAVTALSAEQISTTVIDVTVDDDLSPGRSYLIIASTAITGVAASPDNQALFTAVSLTPPATRDFSALRMVPQMNLREDDTLDLERFLRILDDPIALMLNSVDHWTDILDYDLAPENHLDLMLQSLGYPFQIALTVVDKRRLLSLLVRLFKQKGTVLGMKNAVRFFLGYESDYVFTDSSRNFAGWVLDVDLLDEGSVLGDVTYWIPGIHGLGVDGIWTAYDFYAKIGKGSAFTAAEIVKATAIINYMKPAYTHMLTLTSVLPPPATIAAVPAAGAVSVSWSAVASAASYVVLWALTPFITPLSPTGDVDSASPYVITPVTAGHQRYATVSARDGAGVNGVSSVVAMAAAA
jgi:phage tail-like protein